MALQKIDVPISFGQGIDTKTDPKQVIVGKLLALQNARYKTLNSFIKRNGYDVLSLNILGGGTISNGIGLAAFQNQLNLYDGSNFYAFSESISKWTNKSPLTTANLTTYPVTKNTNNQSSQDSSFHSSGLSAYAYEDSSGGIRYSIVDTATGQQIVDNQLLISTGITPRVVTLGSSLVFFYVDTVANQIQYKVVNVTTPNNLSNSTAVTSDLNATNQLFDSVVVNSKAFIVYTTSSPSTGFYSLNTSLVLSSQYTTGTDVANCIAAYGDVSNNIWVSYSTDVDVRTLIVNNALNSTVLAPTIIDVVPFVRNITGVTQGSTGQLFYEVANSQTTSTPQYVAAYNIETSYMPLIGTGHWADQPFTPSVSGLALSVNIDLYQNFIAGTYTGFVSAEIWSDNAGVPGTLITTSAYINITTPNAAPGTFTTATFTSGVLTAGTLYHLVIDTTNLVLATGSYFLQVGTGQPAATGMHSLITANSGSTWTTHVTGGQPDTLFFDARVNTTATTSNASNNFIRQNTVTLSGTIGAPSVVIRSVGLSSKAFVYNSTAYVISAYPSTLQGKYFLLNSSGQVISRFSGEPNLGGGLTAKSILPSINQLTSDSFQFTYLQVDLITFTASGSSINIIEAASTQSGVMQGTVLFNTGTTYSSISLGSNLNITGAEPTIYDGNNVAEQGFNVYPENLSYIFAPVGGALDPKQYQYVAVYEWTDNYGQKHQSSPSTPLTVDLNPTTAPTSFQITATLSSGQATIATNLTLPLAAGSLVVGNGIPPGTTINSFDSSGADIVLSQVVTASGTEVLTIIPQYQFVGSTQQGSVTLVVQQVPFVQVIADFVSNSGQFTTPDPGPLEVGMLLDPGKGIFTGLIFFPFSLGVGVGSITGDNVTISGSASASNPQFSDTNAVIQAFNFIEGKSDGSNVINSVTFFPADLVIGSLIWGPDGFNVPFTVTALDPVGFTVTLNNNMTSSGAFFTSFPYGRDGGVALNVGQTLVDTNLGLTLQPGTVITAIDGNNITLSLPAISTQTNLTFNTNSVFSTRVTIPTLRVTDKQNVSIALYRTQGDGDIFYRISSATNLIYNDPAVDSITFFDDIPDTAILSNQQLYTTGGEVPNIALPPTNLTAIYNNRQIAVPVEASQGFWYSKQVIPGFPVEFSDSFINNIDQRGGNITAAGVMDDKLIMFKQNNIFYLVAQGPAPNGTNNDFNSGTLIISPVGCVNQNSIVQMPNGLMFQASSGNGIYLLTRDLGITYIGADVEAYNSFTVTSTQLIPTANEVRFTLSNGTILVYDYFVNKWDVDTNLSAVSSCLFQNEFTFLNSNGTVYQEAPGTYTDNGAFIPLGLTTSWLSFAGVQGYQRVYEFDILGQWYSPHNLQVQFAYNFNGAITQTSTILAPSTVTPYQYRVFLDQQKCESVQITLTEQQSSSFGQGLSLSGFNFIVGKKQGHFKIPAAASYG